MAFAAPLAIGMSLVQGVASIAQGNAQSKAYAVQAQEKQQQDQIASQDAQISAQQQQSVRLQDLNRTLGTITATAASRNLDPNSPSGMALSGAARNYALRDVGTIGFNAMQTASNYSLDGQAAVANARAQGGIAQAAGYSGAVGSLFKAATIANSAWG